MEMEHLVGKSVSSIDSGDVVNIAPVNVDTGTNKTVSRNTILMPKW